MVKLRTFIINLEKRKDRKEGVLKEFFNKEEFAIHVVKAISHPVGAIGLWKTIQNILKGLNNQISDFILICEDDHQFTANYSSSGLFAAIAEAVEKEADILCGGVSWCCNAIPVSDNLFWVDRFSGLQFAVIFKTLYSKILRATFEEDDCADYKISDLSDKKFVIYPFISVQKDYGYSDVTSKNNIKGKVTKLFHDSSDSLSSLLQVEKFYRRNALNSFSSNYDYDTISISTYIISFLERREQLDCIKKEFTGRKEFDLTIVEACRHKIGAVGLWQSIIKVISLAIENDEDVIIFCEDDHTFTKFYDRNIFIKNVLDAHRQGCDVLLAGVSGFSHAVPVGDNRYWISSFWGTQFIVIYKKFFLTLLQEPYDNIVTADDKISEMTSHKMVLHPFMSIQHNFGYSDVTRNNNLRSDRIMRNFDIAHKKLSTCASAYKKYLK